jgi:hypothetical protein
MVGQPRQPFACSRLYLLLMIALPLPVADAERLLQLVHRLALPLCIYVRTNLNTGPKSSAIVPSRPVAANATFALPSAEKFRRFAIVVRSSHQRKFHLTTLSRSRGALLGSRPRCSDRFCFVR